VEVKHHWISGLVASMAWHIEISGGTEAYCK